jgi:hypothetical protein
VPETAVHKQVGEYLPGLKKRGENMMECEGIGHKSVTNACLRSPVESILSQKHQPVYNEQVFDNQRKNLKISRSEFSHAILKLCAKICAVGRCPYLGYACFFEEEYKFPLEQTCPAVRAAMLDTVF